MNSQLQDKFEDQMRSMRKTSTLKSVLFTGTFLARFLGPWAGVIGCVATGTVEPIPFLLGASLLNTAICQRALENFVHDASHYNWRRKSSSEPNNAKINDLLATALAAAPVMQDLDTYRKNHDLHHKALGGEDDPCRRRQIMQLRGKNGEISRTKILLYAAQHPLELNLEAMHWKKPRVWIAFAAWHALVMIAPAAIFVGVGPAVLLWLLYWQLPMTTILPMIRAVAERWEHNYGEERHSHAEEDGKIDGSSISHHSNGGRNARKHDIQTYSNLSVVDRVIFHPAGDAYHAAHHAYPYVPAYRMRGLHQLLMKHKAAFAEHPVRLD
jgi:fatty acid desaturase